MLKKKIKQQEGDQEEQESTVMKQQYINTQTLGQQNAMKQVKQAGKISLNVKQVQSNFGQLPVNNLFMQQRNMAAPERNVGSNNFTSIINKRNSSGPNPPTQTLPNEDSGQLQRDFFRPHKKPSVRKKEETIVTPPIILKIGTLTTNSEHSMSADDNYFMPRTTNRQGGGTTGSSSPKVKMVDSEPISDFVNSGRQSLRRMSNLPGIKQRVMNDSTVNQIKQQIMMKNNHNSLMMVDSEGNHQPRFLTKINAHNLQESGSPLKNGTNQGSLQFQTVSSRNKLGTRGPKTIVNRTQGDEVSIVVQKNMKISTYSGSPDRPISTFTQPGKLREIQSTFQLLQAYQPGNNKPDIFKAIALENQKSSGDTLSQGGSVESDSRIKQFGGTFKSNMDLKSKRSEINSKRGTKRSSKPPILPTGIIPPQSQSNTPSVMTGGVTEIPVIKKQNKNGQNNGGAFSTYSGAQSASNYQNSSYFVQSPDERVKQNLNSKLPQTKIGRNYQFQSQQPHTVREEVVQISATISSTNTSQQKPAATSVKENHLRTPLKVKTILQDNNNRGSQPPSTMQVWSAVTMGSGGGVSDLGSQDDGTISLVNKRNFGRPSAAIIKIRRKEGTVVNTINKLATLRAASNDSLEENHSRQRNESIGSEVAIIEEGNLIADELEGSLDDENSIERQQRRRRESQGAFHKMIQMKQQSKTKRLALGINEQVNTYSNASRNSPLARGGVNFPAPPGTNENNLSPQIQGTQGQRQQPLEITQSSLTDSQKQLLNNGHHKNRLPPSLKNYERDAILLSSGTLSSHLNTSNKDSVEINDAAKKKIIHHKNFVKQSENILTQTSKLQIVEERRTSKFISMGGGNQQFRNNSQPAPSMDQQTSSTSSKIDKILAKIEKNRSDSVLKNQIGQILKKNQFLAQTNSENCLNQDSNRRESSSQKLVVLRKENGNSQDDNSPISNNLSRVPQTKQIKTVDESAGSYSTSNMVKQHQKILKLVNVANTNTLMNPSVNNVYSTIQPQSSLQNGKIKKKGGLKISKGSLEKAQQAYATLQNNPHINDTRRQQQQSIKQLRDARSHDIVTNMIEKQGIYLPSEMSQESEFSPSGQINAQYRQSKKSKKKIMVRVQSNEEQKTISKESEPNNMLVITTSGDSQIVYQPQLAAGGGPIKPFKKSIIQSMQPQQPKKVSHQLMMGTNSQQVMVFSSDGSDKQSTEISSHTHPLYPRPSNNTLNQNQQDQSSLLCITSTSNAFKNQANIMQKPKRTSNQQNPMTIMDGIQSPMNSQQNKPTQILFQFPHQYGAAHGKADRTSLKDNNPLDSSVNQPQKISARYHHPLNNGRHSEMQITEDAKEESNSSTSNLEEKKVVQSPPTLKRQTDTLGGSRRVTMPGTVNTSSINHEEVDLHIEPIDTDDKLFKDINLSSRKKQLIQENRQLFDPSHSYRRLKKAPLNKVTTVIEGSELASSNNSHSRQQLVVSRLTNNQLNADIQRYSELETEEIHEIFMVESGKDKGAKTLNHHHFQSSSEDEADEIRVNEEDDEAIMISNHQYAHTTLVPEPQKTIIQDSSNLMRRQSQIKKQKHWLLDSDRFDIMLHNNATTHQQHKALKEADSESNMMQSDTVIFEKDQSSLHGTPPKISQKINQKTMNIKTGGDVQEYEENNDRQVLLDQQDESSARVTDTSRAAMNGQDQKLFAFTQESYDEIRDARQNAYIAKLLLPLDHTDDNKKTVQRLVKDLTKQMNIARSDYRTANNPQWIMQKQLKYLAPLDHYLRPTYYDVIYLQPQLDPATSVANQVATVSQSGNSQVSSATSKVRSSMVVGGSISKYHRPSAGFDQRYLKSKIKPQLEEFNFDALFRH